MPERHFPPPWQTGTRLFLLQQGRSRETEKVFRTLAEQKGGAYFQFNPAVERVAERLPSLLQAVTHFAIGGAQALEAQVNNESVTLLLEQMEPVEIKYLMPSLK
jgi:hypothetical protein